MLRRNMFLKYYQAADDGTGAGGAGDETPATEKTYTQAQLDEEIGRLKLKNDQLIGEKRDAAQKAKDAEAARILAEQVAAKQAGSMEQLEKSVREQKDAEYSPLIQEYEALKARSVMAEKKVVLSGFSNDFITHESLDLISQLVKTELEGAEVKTKFTDFQGNVITTDAAEFKKWMAKHPAISHLMKADGASGGGAIGAKNNASGGAVAKSTADILYPQK